MLYLELSVVDAAMASVHRDAAINVRSSARTLRHTIDAAAQVSIDRCRALLT